MSAPRFKCPCCRSGDTKVTRTVVDVDGAIIRRRRCSDCGHGWYIGVELKPEYAKQAAKFLEQAEGSAASLFDLEEVAA